MHVNFVFCMLCFFLANPCGTQDELLPDKASKFWTNSSSAKAENRNFSLNGEYFGIGADGCRYFLQVRGNEIWKFSENAEQWYSSEIFSGQLYENVSGKSVGGPNLGELDNWQHVCCLHGRWHGDKVRIEIGEGAYEVKLEGENVQLFGPTGKAIAELKRFNRQSRTLGIRPPLNAKVLFDGGSLDSWVGGGKVKDGALLAPAILKTKEAFSDYRIHLEFKHPYSPARVLRSVTDVPRRNDDEALLLHQGCLSVELKDTFCSLLDRESGYPPISIAGSSKQEAKHRMEVCLPPLVWQTFDAVVTAARFDSEGCVVEPSKITAFLNGVVVYQGQLSAPERRTDNVELKRTNSAPISIQSGRCPIQFRNIWIQSK